MIALWLGLFQATAAAQSYEAGLDAVDAGDLPAAVAIWRELIAADSDERPQAEYAMALLYETGQGVEWNELRAAELYASSGLPEALTNLAFMYAEGRGVDYDPTRAAALWQAAAEQGHAFASFNLGLAYYNGQGVEQNAQRALELIYDAGLGACPKPSGRSVSSMKRASGLRSTSKRRRSGASGRLRPVMGWRPRPCRTC